MKRNRLIVPVVGFLASVSALAGQQPGPGGTTPTASAALEEAYQLASSLNHPDDRATVLTLLVGATGSRERVRDWATELFNVAAKSSFPNSKQEAALVALARVDTERAVELFTRQVTPPEGASEDTRTFAARALFPALWARHGKGAVSTIENLAAWQGSTGEYPYAALGAVIPEIAKTDPLLGRIVFLEAVRYFPIEKKFFDSNRAYVDFLVSLKGIPHDAVFRDAVAGAVEAIENTKIQVDGETVQMKIQTAKDTQVFSSEKEYLLYKLLPLIQELDPKWRDRVVETHPTLGGRPSLLQGDGMRFESGVLAQAGAPPGAALEAWDRSQVSRAVEMSRTNPKSAFDIANAISTPQLRDVALASILPKYNDVDRNQSTSTVKELQKHLDSMQTSPEKLALEVKLADALFELDQRSEAVALSQKAMDLGVELFSMDRASHPGKAPFATQGFDGLLDLAGVFGKRLHSAEAEQLILQVRDDSLKACMLVIFGRGLGEAR